MPPATLTTQHLNPALHFISNAIRQSVHCCSDGAFIRARSGDFWDKSTVSSEELQSPLDRGLWRVLTDRADVRLADWRICTKPRHRQAQCPLDFVNGALRPVPFLSLIFKPLEQIDGGWSKCWKRQTCDRTPMPDSGK
ncbi:hypothetical protein GCM10027452_01310 [Micromonospora halotolerans]